MIRPANPKTTRPRGKLTPKAEVELFPAEWTPAVAYIRMSSLKQDASPEQQRQEAAKLAALHKCRIIREYTDEGISGDDPNRPGFQAMLRDAVEKRDFRVILCWDQDRFARFDSIKAGKYIDPIREVGVRLITKAQGVVDWNTFAGRMMYSIIQEGKHQYLLDLSRNVLRGRIASARAGRLIVQPAYGYDRAFYDEAGRPARRVPYGEKFNCPKGWTVKLEPADDAEKVSTVQWMMEVFGNSDWSLRGIAKDLNRRGVVAPRGKGWNSNTVRYILTHRVYLGNRGFGERKGGKYHQVGDDGEIQQANGKANRAAPIVAENTHEALVPVELFNRVQAKLAERATSSTRPRMSPYVLREVLKCGHCGRHLSGQPAAKGSDRRYYRCPAGNDGRCKNYSIRKEQIEGYVLGFLDRWLDMPENATKIETALRRLEKSRKGSQRATQGLQAKIAALDKKITRGTENLLLAAAENVPELSGLLSTWRKERSRLQSEVEAGTANPAGHDVAKITERALAHAVALRENLNSDDPALVRAVVKELVGEVTLFWESDGKRYRRLAKGIITVKHVSGFALDSSSTASGCRRWETSGLSRPPAR